jgi:hypothetical protein
MPPGRRIPPSADAGAQYVDAALNEFWTLRLAVTVLAYVLAVGFLGLFWVVIYKIATDKIDLGSLIRDRTTGGVAKTSIARFQLLVFTLTIAGLYTILSIESGILVEVPDGTLALLGISGGSFLLSKSIGKSKTTPLGPAK